MKQKCKVVALPTKDKQNGIVINTHGIKYENDLVHLYLVSDEQIKEGDYMILKEDHSHGRLRVCHWIGDNRLYIDAKEDIGWGFVYRNEVCKVIATTDEQLNLPIVPERLIKEYCDKGGIDEVMVEIKVDYHAICEISTSDCRLYNNGRTDCEDCVKAKKVIEVSPVKESWTIEDVERLCRKAFQSGFYAEEGYGCRFCENEFIKNNL